jgi:hypothetical protein
MAYSGKERKRVLITVKTYPTLSSKYDELVCTAGFLEDGSWVRIYPIPFRKKAYDEQYNKYDWIEVNLTKNTSDFRPESYRPYSYNSEIKIDGHIDTGKRRNWAKRKEIVLQNVSYDMSKLIEEAKDQSTCTSLAVFKPQDIIDFEIEEVEREWDKKKIERLKANRDQGGLFENPEDPFEVVKKLPYKFKYRFKDCNGKESCMMIEDWEIGQLYWNSLRRHDGNETKAVRDVEKKYFDNFAKSKDLYLYLGTTQLHHFTARNPFMIIGVFYPPIDPKANQQSLF